MVAANAVDAAFEVLVALAERPTPVQLSEAVGGVQLTNAALHWLVVLETVWFGGQAPSSGSSSSVTTTVSEQLAVFPPRSVPLKVRVVVPTGKFTLTKLPKLLTGTFTVIVEGWGTIGTTAEAVCMMLTVPAQLSVKPGFVIVRVAIHALGVAM